ncbi:hypothetical protein TWF481_003871 [Arthrobotrys musiformis]|uniref:Sulfhydryl oxidase n=1 Tax=Arthrobotrys musiformis TaxID=47236 RepID=A0AAV9WI14_9PEZI
MPKKPLQMTTMTRTRPITYIAIILAFVFFYSYVLLPSHPTSSPYNSPEKSASWKGDGVFKTPSIHAPGEVIMPKLGNETIKQELGRASWKLLHTMLARFPENPSVDEREALKSYLYLFGRLYPCGECATHFRLLLQKYPPQTSSRDAASQWGCVVHNAVNERLRKPIFDCGTIADKYHCGCAEEDEKKRKEAAEGEDDDEGEMKLVKEGLTRGG